MMMRPISPLNLSIARTRRFKRLGSSTPNRDHHHLFSSRVFTRNGDPRSVSTYKKP